MTILSSGLFFVTLLTNAFSSAIGLVVVILECEGEMVYLRRIELRRKLKFTPIDQLEMTCRCLA